MKIYKKVYIKLFIGTVDSVYLIKYCKWFMFKLLLYAHTKLQSSYIVNH